MVEFSVFSDCDMLFLKSVHNNASRFFLYVFFFSFRVFSLVLRRTRSLTVSSPLLWAMLRTSPPISPCAFCALSGALGFKAGERYNRETQTPLLKRGGNGDGGGVGGGGQKKCRVGGGATQHVGTCSQAGRHQRVPKWLPLSLQSALLHSQTHTQCHFKERFQNVVEFCRFYLIWRMWESCAPNRDSISGDWGQSGLIMHSVFWTVFYIF